MKPSVTVRRFAAADADLWGDFLRESGNGTLFHSLDFLAYHGPEKFQTHHLLFFSSGKLVALLPAAVAPANQRRRVLESPYGASVGGFVVKAKLAAETALAMVGTLQEYAQQNGIDLIRLRLAPNIYARPASDLFSYCLMARQFQLARRWALHVVSLRDWKRDSVFGLLSKRKRDYLRSSLKRGVLPREVSAEKLDVFYDLLQRTQARLGSEPTHTKEELRDLIGRVPGRVRLFLCQDGQAEVAGVLVLVLNDTVANTFYICGGHERAGGQGPLVLISHIMEKLRAEGFQYLDLGPSSFDDYRLNSGVARFKESLGAQVHCRDEWEWNAGSESALAPPAR